MSNNQFLTNLKYQAEQNPIAALAVAGLVLTAASKFLNVGTEMINARAWSKEVARRSMKDVMK